MLLNNITLFNFCVSWEGPLWTWSYGSWSYNYLFSQYISPLTLWVRISLRRGVLDTTLCVKVCDWPLTGRWVCVGTLVSSFNKTDRHDINEILLKVGIQTIKLYQTLYVGFVGSLLLFILCWSWSLLGGVNRVRAMLLNHFLVTFIKASMDFRTPLSEFDCFLHLLR